MFAMAVFFEHWPFPSVRIYFTHLIPGQLGFDLMHSYRPVFAGIISDTFVVCVLQEWITTIESMPKNHTNKHTYIDIDRYSKPKQTKQNKTTNQPWIREHWNVFDHGQIILVGCLFLIVVKRQKISV